MSSSLVVDKESGMLIDKNWELVKANCTGCHSAPHITSQKNDREGWIEVIRWMQNKQGLWQFDADTENKILDYLTANYGLIDERNVQKIDLASGMVIDDNWELVKASCTGCHSAKIVIQQGADRNTWLEIIRWMQEEQGLWQFDADTENKILDYLSKNYSQSN
ncbi:hypothetical protein QUF50_06900 [Thiotrichales bacterium HSG1]|nr:hypothetical protein [Thiotrichales bacterium HSG1]